MDRLQQMLVTIQRALTQPGANPQATALVIGALAVLALILVLVIFWFLTPKTRKVVKRVYFEPGAEPLELAPQTTSGSSEIVLGPAAPQRPPRKPLPKGVEWLLGPALVPLLVAAALVASYAATSTDDYCARSCHRGSAKVLVADKIGHADCVDCHAAPGIAGVPGNIADRLRMALVRAGGGKPDKVRAVVAPWSCLDCHDDIESGYLQSSSANVRMRHAEPLEAGMHCSNCHGAVGHIERRQAVPMSKCIICHDSEQASAECNTCHTTDIGSTPKKASSKAVGSGKYRFPPVKISDTGCGACHDEKRQCDTCHTLRMPHSQAFKSGFHARQAAFEKKASCWRCHVEADCSRCHLVPFSSGHSSGWKQDHKRSRPIDTCTCHERGQKLQPGQMCGYCHGVAPSE